MYLANSLKSIYAISLDLLTVWRIFLWTTLGENSLLLSSSSSEPRPTSDMGSSALSRSPSLEFASLSSSLSSASIEGVFFLNFVLAEVGFAEIGFE